MFQNSQKLVCCTDVPGEYSSKSHTEQLENAGAEHFLSHQSFDRCRKHLKYAVHQSVFNSCWPSPSLSNKKRSSEQAFR